MLRTRRISFFSSAILLIFGILILIGLIITNQGLPKGLSISFVIVYILDRLCDLVEEINE